LLLDVKFLGYTNDAAGTRLVAFEVVNRSSFGVYRWGDSYEEVAPGATPRTFPNGRGGYLLPPGTHETLLLLPPPITNSWRLKLLCTEQEPVPDRLFYEIMLNFGYQYSQEIIFLDGPIVEPQ